jgi:hypothetical protein
LGRNEFRREHGLHPELAVLLVMGGNDIECLEDVGEFVFRLAP